MPISRAVLHRQLFFIIIICNNYYKKWTSNLVKYLVYLKYPTRKNFKMFCFTYGIPTQMWLNLCTICVITIPNRVKKRISLAVRKFPSAPGMGKRIELLQYMYIRSADVLRWSAFREAAYSRAPFIGCHHPRGISGITYTIIGLFVIDNELITS